MIAEIKPSKTQEKAWDKLQDNTTHYILYGGSMYCGKTWLGCEWLFVLAHSFPGTRYFIGRNELKELRQSTLVTFYKVIRHHKLNPTDIFKYNAIDHFLQFHNGSRIDLIDLKSEPSDPFYQRLGSTEYTSGFIDESATVEFGAFEMLKTRVGRCENKKYNLVPGKILLTANPSKNWLYHTFYIPNKEGRLPIEYAFIQALPKDNEYLEESYFDALSNLSNKVHRERLILGNWEYSDAESQLMSYDSILSIFTNDYVKEGVKYMTIDVARFGRDKAIIRIWAGYKVIERLSYSSVSITQLAEIVKSKARLHQIPVSRILADEGGVGGGLVDIVGCKGFVSNASPINPKPGENYRNLKSQCAFKLASLVNNHQIYEPCYEEDVKQLIIEDLEQIKEENIDKDSKRSILSKDKVKEILGRSPDDGDTYIMRMYFELNSNKGVTFTAM